MNMDSWKQLHSHGKEWLALYSQGRCIWAKEKTITGAPPLQGVPMQRKSIKSWSLKGNEEHTGTAAPTSPITPQGTGERTGQTIQFPYSSGSAEVDGITWTMHQDGKLTGSGTSTKGTNYYLVNRGSLPLKAGTYTLSWQGDKNINLILRNNTTSTNITNIGGLSKSATFTIENDIPETDLMSLYFNTSVSGTAVSIDGYPMLNLGSTALPYEPYGYKVTTTNRGKNLFDKVNAILINGYPAANNVISASPNTRSTFIKCEPNKTYTISRLAGERFITAYTEQVPDIGVNFYGTVSGNEESHLTITTGSTAKYLVLYFYHFAYDTETVQDIVDSIMIEEGSTATPYEPYREPITTTVYLGQTQTVRRIKKLVLTGNEDWYTSNSRFYIASVIPDYLRGANQILAICSHYSSFPQTSSAQGVPAGNISFSFTTTQRLYCYDTTIREVADFKSYLAAQYTAGTPVTVWYVLATPETAIVNEPLMKIGDYADELRSTEAGVSIPTAEGTNVFNTDTTVKPSSMTLTYR